MWGGNPSDRQWGQASERHGEPAPTWSRMRLRYFRRFAVSSVLRETADPMEVLTGPYTAAVGLLFAAGVAKAWRPAATARTLTDAGLPGRGGIAIVLGAVEVVVAATAAVATGPVPAALVAVCYLGFAGFVALGMRRGTRGSCGCFGAGTSVPPGVPHLIVNLAAAAVAAAVALAPPAGGLAGVLGRSPLAGLPLLAATAVCGWLAYLV